MESFLHQVCFYAYVQVRYDICVIDPERRDTVDRLYVHQSSSLSTLAMLSMTSVARRP